MKSKTARIVEMLVLIAAGLILLLYPGKSLTAAVKILGVALLAFGVVAVLRRLLSKEQSGPDLAAGIVAALAGLLVLLAPKLIVSIFPFVAGILILLAGVKGIVSALSGRRSSRSWLLGCVFSAVTAVLGAVILMNPFGAAETVVSVLGIALLYIGVTGIIAAAKA